jgi:hypothetical protein
MFGFDMLVPIKLEHQMFGFDVGGVDGAPASCSARS